MAKHPFMAGIKRRVGVTSLALLAMGLLGGGTQAYAVPPPVACGALVMQNIKLLADVGPCPGDGLVVAANGVSINLNGHKVFATQRLNIGIRLENVSNVSVVGGTVGGFDTGVLIVGGLADTVAYMTVQNNRFGIQVQEAPSSGHQVSKNVVTNNRLIGILLSPSVSGATVNKNSVSDNVGYGIVLDGGSSLNVINGNSAFNNASRTWQYFPGGPNAYPDINLRGASSVATRSNLFPPVLAAVSPSLPPFVAGVDYGVLSADAASDVTARLVPIGIVFHPAASSLDNPIPADTSTSGCNGGDFVAAGFQAGDIALVQRGTCELGVKVLNAYFSGASGVILFNEGQAPTRTAFDFGEVEVSWFSIPVGGFPPVVGASYATGYALYNLTRANTVFIRLSAAAPIQGHVLSATGSANNVVTMNSATRISDDNATCANQWTRNTFVRADTCAGAEGESGNAGGGSTIHSY
jgi:parallel beta-helix repeat protein